MRQRINKQILGITALSFMACQAIIGVTDISTETVELLAPSNNAQVANDPMSFVWEPIIDAESYRIQIAQPNFENAQQIFTDSTVTTTNFIRSLENGNYQWRVKAMNSAFETLYSTNSFLVDVQD